MRALEPWHFLVLIVVIGVLFGGKKLPDAARSLGRSMRIFKSEIEEMKKDGDTKPSAASSDTVKGEAVPPSGQSPESTDPIQDPTQVPTKKPTPDPSERE